MSKPTIYIRDDDGHAWYFRDGKIRMVLAELEAKTKQEREENSYLCADLVHGLELLNEFGYITGYDEPSTYDDETKNDYDLDFVPYTAFGKTRMVPCNIWDDKKKKYINSNKWDIDIWIEREEDMYGLSSPEYKNKKVLIVRRNEWINGDLVK